MADHRIGTPRDVTEQAPFEVIDRIDDALLAVPTVAQEAAQETAREEAQVEARAEVRRNWRWTNIAAAIVAIVVSIATSSIAYSVAANASARADQGVAIGQSAQRTIDDALAKLAEANKELEARGQAPVTTPPDPDPSEAIQAAVLAKVLAQLPKAPTAEQVAAILQPAVAAQVTGPSRDALASLVASYFAQNPTAAQIQAAVNDFLSRNPPAPGPKGDPGRDGDKGEKGDKGDSPPCLEEASACRGADGADSTVAGPPGPPVGSWSWPDPVVPAVTHTCTRSGGPDDAAVYSCT